MLELLLSHLTRVAEKADTNLMSVSNIGTAYMSPHNVLVEVI